MDAVKEAKYIDLVFEISCEEDSIQSFSDRIADLKDSLGLKEGFLNFFDKISVIGKIISNWFAIIGAKIQLSIAKDQKKNIEDKEQLTEEAIIDIISKASPPEEAMPEEGTLEFLKEKGKRVHDRLKRQFPDGIPYDILTEADRDAIARGSKAGAEIERRNPTS